eukprot:3624114-Prymnesium_polylepis.3
MVRAMPLRLMNMIDAQARQPSSGPHALPADGPWFVQACMRAHTAGGPRKLLNCSPELVSGARHTSSLSLPCNRCTNAHTADACGVGMCCKRGARVHAAGGARRLFLDGCSGWGASHELFFRRGGSLWYLTLHSEESLLARFELVVVAS